MAARLIRVTDTAERDEYLNPDRIIKAYPVGDGRMIVKSTEGEVTYTTEEGWAQAIAELDERGEGR